MHKRSPLATLGLYAVLLFWTFVVAFPFYWMLTTSFKKPLDVNRIPRYIPYVDFQPITDHWEFLFGTQGESTVRHFRNSLVIAGLTTLTTTLVGALAGYALSRFRYYWARLGWDNNNIAFWIISQRFLPPAVLVIPFLLAYSFFNIDDTHFGMVLAYTAFNIPFSVWIMRDFFNGLPIDLEESARVDGATRLQTFLRIVVPLSGPGLITVALLTFIFAYNEYLFALMLTSTNAITMPVLIAGQNSTRGTEWWYLSALTLVTIAPVVILGVFLTRYLVRGLVAGAIRG